MSVPEGTPATRIGATVTTGLAMSFPAYQVFDELQTREQKEWAKGKIQLTSVRTTHDCLETLTRRGGPCNPGSELSGVCAVNPVPPGPAAGVADIVGGHHLLHDGASLESLTAVETFSGRIIH